MRHFTLWGPSFAVTGAAVFPGALSTTQCNALLEEWRIGPWKQAQPIIGQVRQVADVAEADLPCGRLATDCLAAELASELADAEPALTTFSPNEVSVMRYSSAGVGVSSHRDSRRYVLAVVIVGLSGSGQLLVVADRAATVIHERIEVRPGTIAVLRGAPLHEEEDLRPMHIAQTLEAPRVSLTFRMRQPEEHGDSVSMPALWSPITAPRGGTTSSGKSEPRKHL